MTCRCVVTPGKPAISTEIAGNTVWYDPAAESPDCHDPDMVVVSGGAAQFVDGDPITMDDGERLSP